MPHHGHARALQQARPTGGVAQADQTHSKPEHNGATSANQSSALLTENDPSATHNSRRNGRSLLLLLHQSSVPHTDCSVAHRLSAHRFRPCSRDSSVGSAALGLCVRALHTTAPQRRRATKTGVRRLQQLLRAETATTQQLVRHACWQRCLIAQKHWRLPHAHRDDCGRAGAALPCVPHCSQRSPHPLWTGRGIGLLLASQAAQLRAQVGVWGAQAPRVRAGPPVRHCPAKGR